ncbi:MAG: tyrosinase family protein [Pyrinomonadaceae bacterium]|nr:tyrosinase family protein [Phycisphaerales bacterium]
MRVPPALYAAMMQHHAHGVPHAEWHAARIPKDLVPVNARVAWEAARKVAKYPVDWNTPGAGLEFLEFHRTMMRNFLWIRPQAGLTSAFAPWPELPEWLRKLLPEDYLNACLFGIKERIAGGSADELGGFLEATGGFNGLGSNIHNIAHGLIALDEVKRHKSTPGNLADAGMDDPSTAHHNEHFWLLHGWIDNLYASWQRKNNEPHDQSPLNPMLGNEPEMPGDHMHMASAPIPVASPHDMPHAHADAAPTHAHPDPRTDEHGGSTHIHEPDKKGGSDGKNGKNGEGEKGKKPPQPTHKPTLAPALRAILRARFNPL